MDTPGPRSELSQGAALYALAAELYPILRSITGEGLRRTLRMIGQHIPLDLHEVPSATPVFDWVVPQEWNIEQAWIEDPAGHRVVDLRDHNLHIMSYSEPVDAVLDLDQLQAHLHSLPEHPDWIPYRTSYYRRQWGFCLSQRQRDALPRGRYRVHVGSRLEDGALSYAECRVPGRSRDEVLLFTHACHPSLANDNASGLAVATALAQWLAAEPRRYSYRLVLAPGTIGSLCWLHLHRRQLGRVRHGLVLGLLGDPAPLTYKRSRRGDRAIDRIVPYVLRELDPAARVVDFDPYGYDERQLCSPGFDLPVGRLTRSINGGYPQYHSSADDLSLIGPQALERSLEACRRTVTLIEQDRRYVNLQPWGEPQLGKRGLYGAVGGGVPKPREQAMLWVLNQSDGDTRLLDIAERSSLGFDAVHAAAQALAGAGLLRAAADASPGRNGNRGKRK